ITLAVALLVGWVYVIWRNLSLTQQYARNTWLLVAGIISLATIIAVLVLFAVFLAREINELRRQTRFIDSVTHELRSPLASIRLCLETLGRADLPAEQSDSLREMILDDLERLNGFINDILEASRLEHSHVLKAAQPVDLQAVIDSAWAAVCQRHKGSAGEARLKLETPITLVTDRSALEIVLKNLLDNAVKYSNPPYSVTVSAECSDAQGVTVRVRDRGIGMQARELKRVFDRFYRVPKEAVRARRGTGLGLFVVAAAVRDLGGKIRLRSDGPDEGVEAVVQLPLRPRRGKPSPRRG
ncbi:MAG: sensor histidine kinase, partial [Polyangiales bacterium]